MAEENPHREFVHNLPRLDPGRLRPCKRKTTKRPLIFTPGWDASLRSSPDTSGTEGHAKTPQSRRISLPASVSFSGSDLEASESLHQPSPETRRVSLPAPASLNQSALLRRVRSRSVRKPTPQSKRTESPIPVASNPPGLLSPKRSLSVRQQTPQSKRTESPIPVASNQSALLSPKNLSSRSVHKPTPQSKRTESPIPVASNQPGLLSPKNLRSRSVRKPTPQSKRTESPIPVALNQPGLLSPKRSLSVRQPTPQSNRTESPIPVASNQPGLLSPKRSLSVRQQTPQSKRTESPIPVASNQSELLSPNSLRRRSVRQQTPQSDRTESPVPVSSNQSSLSPVKSHGRGTPRTEDQSSGMETESTATTDDQLTDGLLLVSNLTDQSLSDHQSPRKGDHFKQNLQRLPSGIVHARNASPRPTIPQSVLKANKGAILKTPVMKRTSPRLRRQSAEMVTQHYTTLPPESGPVVRQKRRRHESPPETGEVRMWSGKSWHRTAADIIDLDVILEMVEEVSLEYKDNVESSVVKKAVNEFFTTFRKTAIDFIDLSQEHKVLRSAVSRNDIYIVRLRKEIFDLKKAETTLDTELLNMKRKLEEMEMEKKDLLEISEFQFDLQDILQEYAGTDVHTRPADYKSGANVPAMMTDVTNTITTVSNLRSVNDGLQHWLDGH